MELNTLKYAYKSRGHKTKTYGRGKGSGIGGTSTRGNNGQHQRKSGNTRPGFEGGQTPIYRRLPKVGFVNQNKKDYHEINLKELVIIPELTDINLQTLKEYRFLPKSARSFKVIGNDKLQTKLNVTCNFISKQAKEQIEQAGGTVTIIEQSKKQVKASPKKLVK